VAFDTVSTHRIHIASKVCYKNLLLLIGMLMSHRYVYGNEYHVLHASNQPRIRNTSTVLYSNRPTAFPYRKGYSFDYNNNDEYEYEGSSLSNLPSHPIERHVPYRAISPMTRTDRQHTPMHTVPYGRCATCSTHDVQIENVSYRYVTLRYYKQAQSPGQTINSNRIAAFNKNKQS